jgi:YD repeat-containing protein
MRVSAGPSGKVVASGLGGAIGSRYDPANNRLIFVEFATGKLSSVTLNCSPSYTTLGTGYDRPEDVALSRDGRTAYVTERGGNLVKVSLSNANRSAATLVASGLAVPHQIVLDESQGVAYTVEWVDAGRLVRINLANGTVSKVTDVRFGIGLLLSADKRIAYVTEQLPNSTGQLVRIDLASGQRRVLFTSSTAPLFEMSWTDATQQALYIPERDAGNKVWFVDVQGRSRLIADNLPARPSSVTVVSPGRLLICSDSQVVQINGV